jgi:hypothetical protein
MIPQGYHIQLVPTTKWDMCLQFRLVFEIYADRTELNTFLPYIKSATTCMPAFNIVMCTFGITSQINKVAYIFRSSPKFVCKMYQWDNDLIYYISKHFYFYWTCCHKIICESQNPHKSIFALPLKKIVGVQKPHENALFSRE